MIKKLLPRYYHWLIPYGMKISYISGIAGLILMLGFFNPMLALAQQSKTKITLDVKEMPMDQVFKIIEKQTSYSFVFNNDQLKGEPKFTGTYSGATVFSVLDAIFRNSRFEYEIKDNVIVVRARTEKRQKFLTGTVSDAQGNNLPGVTVAVSGTNNKVSSDKGGRYSINVPDNLSVNISFSYVGSKTKVLLYTPGMQVLDVKLEDEMKGLNEVAITGYQNIKRELVTGAIQSIKIDSIMVPGFSTVDNMLEGRVPGLTFMQSSGQKGAAPKLRIRGTSTMLGNQEPLWVIDGIVQSDPVNISASQINDLDFVNLVGNAISGLNPNDIDQIDILKDAAATALYGVRAANGVIVITTKRGKEGAPSVNYSVNTSYSTRPRYTDKAIYLMNSKERVDVSREMIQKQREYLNVINWVGYEQAIIDYYAGKIDYETYKVLINKAETVNTDWFDNVARDAVSSNHTLGVSGGSQVVRYYASAGYNNELGNIKNEFNKRYNGNVKFDLNYKKFKALFNISANTTSRQYNPSGLGVMNYAYSTSRAIPLYNEDGSLHYYNVGSSGNGKGKPFNVLNEMDHSGNTVKGTSLTATANLNYDILPELKLNTIFSYTTNNTDERTWYEESTNHMQEIASAATALLSKAPFGGELSQKTTKNNAYTIRGQADYSKFMDGEKKHLFSASVGGEVSSTSYDGISQTRRGYYPERGKTFANVDLSRYTGYRDWLQTAGQATISESLSNLMSVYTTASYVYDNRYILNFNVRTDFSNAFGSRSNEKFLPVYSVSGRWNAHRDLLKDVSWVNLLALRGSYGKQGNMLNNQTSNLVISKGELNPYYEDFSSTIAYFPNPGLRWEQTHSYNGGLDFSFFNNMINGSISYYYKRTVDAFLNKKVSEVNGVVNYTVNKGTLENKGVELAFSFTPVNNIGGKGKRGFMWRIDPQLGQALSTLINRSINNSNNTLIDENAVTYADYLNGSMPIEGRPLNTFYSYRFKGLDHSTGSPIFYGAEDADKVRLAALYSRMTRQEVIMAVMTESGTRVPTLQGGLSNYFGYGNWGLSFNMTYSLGNKIRLLKIASGNYGTYAPVPNLNLRGEFVNRWRYPGDEATTNIPGLQTKALSQMWWEEDQLVYNFAGNVYQMYDESDLRVVSGDYFKLQSASLRYNLSKEMCKKLKIKAATLNLGGANLFTIANKALRGQDPGQSGSSPNVNISVRPMYTFNINLTL